MTGIVRCGSATSLGWGNMARWWILLLFALTAPGAAFADEIVAPDHTARDATETTADQGEYPTRPWSLPPLEVRGQRKSPLVEEQRIGDYKQPRWTAQRRFPTTRVYVVPRGKSTFEYWNRWNAPLSSPIDARRVRSLYEWEFGLGHRLQFDIYLQTEATGYTGDFQLNAEKLELRYALADWGELWGNPTLYLEWSRHHREPDAVEAKLLLGGELAVGLHGGLNIVVERTLGGAMTNEYVVVGGLSKTLRDGGLALGVEGKWSLLDGKAKRFSALESAILVGPSVALSPIPPMNILLTTLLGQGTEGGDSKAVLENWLIIGWTM